MMRLAMPWTSSNLCRERLIRGVNNILGDSTLLASSASLHTTVNPPTRSPRPMFLASRSTSPLAKPW
uniref:Uncharacterized protein n=1 Tax=Hucho hucho TaxID=62062 RepID=A0A4W5MPJ6_9TELE